MGKWFLTYYFDWSDESIKKEDELSTKQSLCIYNLILTLFHQIVLVYRALLNYGKYRHKLEYFK